ncbi:HalOD1 output domain-containing protein [Halorientalis pallida]|uniref:HalOD1 output domain-containing protein n=1 Tax=Halorientalis pallida TaxID=2479928 RepID=UPI003C6F2A8B
MVPCVLPGIMRASFSDTSGVPGSNKPIVESVVNAVARVEGVDPVDLSEPVFAFVDPDALDALVASSQSGTGLTVVFEAWGHEIVIEGDGTITVDGEPQDQATFEGVARTGPGNHR